MKKLLTYASDSIEMIDHRAIIIMKTGVVITNILIIIGCVLMLFPSIIGSQAESMYYAHQILNVAMRSVVLCTIASFIADVLFRESQ